MSGRRTDRRTERTRQVLMQAFVELLLSEELDKATIAAIVARADVGRSTFYTHFRSRDDILKASLSFPSAPLVALVQRPVEAAVLLPLLAHFRRQPRLARAFSEGSLRRLWVRRLAELLEPELSAVARRARGQQQLPLPLVSLQVAELQISLITHWLASRESTPMELVAETLIALTRAAVATLLAAPDPEARVSETKR